MEKIKELNLSISPSYKCNLCCDFCYLSENERRRGGFLELEKLEEMLKSLMFKGYKIQDVDIYGGEVSIMPEKYLNDMFDLVNLYANKINVVSNLVTVNKAFLRNDIDLSVSYDFEARSHSYHTLYNIMTIGRGVNILMLVSPSFTKRVRVDDICSFMNIAKNAKTLELKPYSRNQYNDYGILNREYMSFVRGIIEHPNKEFHFINEENIKRCLKGEYNAYSDRHLYITPYEEFAVLDFDENDKEYFKVIDLDSLSRIHSEEKERLVNSSLCSDCIYLGKCLTEHYRREGCSGFKELLDFYSEYN